MNKKSPYDVIKSRHVTEKAQVLGNLYKNESNPCVRKCDTPKYVFLVDKRANKVEIAEAVEAIYAQSKIKVIAVNTINRKQEKRLVRGRESYRPAYKKAVVTLRAGDLIEEKIMDKNKG
jgi:large subunit ribosomal protein L23